MADVSVRPARAGDVSEIARIQLETWRFGYRDVVPAAVLDALTPEVAIAAWREAVTSPPSPKHRVLVAVEQDRVVGFAAIAAADDGLADNGLAEGADAQHTALVGPLLVEPRWGRRGHASRLMAATVDSLRQDGVVHALVWIPEADTASREFLVGAGWALDGMARALDTGAGELREVRLHTTLPG